MLKTRSTDASVPLIPLPAEYLPVDAGLTESLNNKSVFKNTIAYSGTNIIAQVAAVSTGFAMRRILAPELMGIWELVGVIRSYLQAINLGTLSGASMELPLLRGARQYSKETRYRSVAFTYSLCEIMILALCVWAYSLWRVNPLPRERLAFVVAGILLITGRLLESYITFFQASQSYLPLSRVLLINNLLGATLLLAGSILGGIRGLLGAAVLSEGIQIVVASRMAKKAGLVIHFIWDTPIWKHLSSHGILYRLTDYPNTFFSHFDLLWVAKFVGIEGLALYAFAKTFFSIALDITVRMGTVVYTRALHQFGGNTPISKIADDLRRYIQFQLLACVPLVGCLVVSGSSFVIRHFVPKYNASIPLIPLLILPLFFVLQNNNLCAGWVAQKRFLPWGLSNIWGTVAVVSSIAFSWFLMGRQDMESIARAAVIGYALYFAYTFFAAGREFWGLAKTSKLFLQIMLAAGWTGTVFIKFSRRTTPNLTWQRDLLHSGLTAVEMFVLILPLLIIGTWLSGGRKYLHQILNILFRTKGERRAYL